MLPEYVSSATNTYGMEKWLLISGSSLLFFYNNGNHLQIIWKDSKRAKT